MSVSDKSTDRSRKGKQMRATIDVLRDMNRVVLLSTSIIGTALTTTVFAQSAGSGAAAADGQAAPLTEIVVTATRKSRAEALKDVPLAIAAFTGQQLEAQHVQTLVDVGRMTAGARLEANGTFPAAANFFIRGVGVNTSNPSDDPTVGVFVDGMYLGVNVGALTDLFDIESVEVLRGPQGTLFGRNVTGGAVLVRSKRPTGDFGARAEATVGSFDRVDVNAAIEGPLLKDRLNGKLAVSRKDNGGYFSNAADPDNRIAETDAVIVRPMLEWRANDFTFTLIGEMGRQDDYGTPTKNLAIKPAAIAIAPPVPTGKFDLTANIFAHTSTDWDQMVGEANWTLGEGKLTTILGYRKLEVDGQAEIDGTEASLFQFETPTGLRQRQRSAEVVYATRLFDRVDLTSGANVFDQDVDYRESRTILASRPAGRGVLEHTAGGIFAQADIGIVADVTATVGGRYTIERKHATVANFGQCDPQVIQCNFGTNDSQTWRDFTPKAGVRWAVTDDLMTYASFTRGFRSGGYNLRNSVGPAGPYDPENVDAYEIGIKSVLFDGLVRANVALYRNQYSDLQRQTLDDQARQRTLNAASARIEGAELDVVLVPFEGLSLAGTFATTEGRYSEFNGVDLTGDGIADPDLAKSLKLARLPRQTYSFNVSYAAQLADRGSLTFQASYDRTGRRSANDLNTFFLDAYGLVEGSITFKTADERYYVSLFGKNLTNELYGTTGTDIGTFRALYIGAPRNWGVTFGTSF